MIEVSGLLAGAKEATGFSDFGGDGYLEGLEILVDSANREAALNDAGRAMFAGQAVMMLSKRLEIESWYARHPEIDEQEIVAPLMVLGLPRTGSTALHCLLGEDPAVRVLRNWECLNPCPPPETATENSDPRIAVMEAQMALRDTLTPRMKQMLPSTATSPTEDQLTMGYDFKSQVFFASYRVPAYANWLMYKADLVPTFRYVKRVLKLLRRYQAEAGLSHPALGINPTNKSGELFMYFPAEAVGTGAAAARDELGPAAAGRARTAPCP